MGNAMKWFARMSVLALVLVLGAPARGQEITIPLPQPQQPSKSLAFTTILSGPNGPKTAMQLKIDTDTGYGSAITQIYMVDQNAVMSLPSNLQEINDAQEWAAFIALGEKTGTYSI